MFLVRFVDLKEEVGKECPVYNLIGGVIMKFFTFVLG